MNFEIEFDRASILKTIADTIKDLTQVVVFEISPNNGLSMQAMDSAAVSLCVLNIPVRSFTRFETNEDHSVGVHVGALTMVMKCFNVDGRVVMKSSGDKFILTDEERFTFHLSQVDISVDKLELPQISYTTFIKLKSDFVRKLMHDMGEFGSRCSLASCNGVLTIEFSGGTYGKACVDVKDATSGQDLTSPLILSLRHLRIFSKASSLGEDITIEASSGQPLKFTYGFYNGSSTLTFFLAPQIQD